MKFECLDDDVLPDMLHHHNKSTRDRLKKQFHQKQGLFDRLSNLHGLGVSAYACRIHIYESIVDSWCILKIYFIGPYLLYTYDLLAQHSRLHSKARTYTGT
jgi:hypothetical protein